MFGSKSQFDKLLEKATSQLLLEPDWDSILQITDCIRQGDVQTKYAANAIRRKIGTENPHVSLYGLQVLESCMKNCGTLIHAEVASKEYMEFLKNLVNSRGDPVKGKILELIQVWSHAFRNEPSYKIVQDTYNLMKLEGYSFPQLKESDAMFSAETAPEWKDADCCSRCRTTFGMVVRKHHCRACGDIVCQKCSSKNSIIPKFGIEKEVRVCDSCYDKINKQGAGKSEDDLPTEYLNSPLSKQSQVSSAPQRSEAEIQEEEELQLALALSQSEEESKRKERDRLRSNYGIYGGGGGSTSQQQQQPARSTSPVQSYQPATVSAPVIESEDLDPELARYLNRNYWQQKSETIKTTGGNPGVASSSTTTQPSAPVAQVEPKNTQGGGKVQEVYQNGETEEDPEQFLQALNSSVEIFVNRMRSNSQRGRSIATDSSVQSLFNVISNMHPQLMKYVQSQEDMRAHYETLQDKLAQLRDAREALDALREDHREKRRREMEELERQRQIQMQQKLDIMRQKKHEYLEMQRQLALQRLQEQEREMQMRMEQQRQMTQMRQMQNYGYNQSPYQQGPGPVPGMAPPQGVPQGYSPAVGAQMEGSPVHQLHQQQNVGGGPGGYMGQMPASQQMYAPQQPGQPNYSQAGPAGQQPMYQSLPPGGHPQSMGQQPPQQPGGGPQYLSQTDGPAPAPGPAQIPPGGYTGMDGMPPQGGAYQPQGTVQYSTGASGAQSLPAAMSGQMPMNNQQNPGYTLPQQNMPDYQQQGAYNMQGMANTLPSTDGQGYNPQQQQQQPQQQQYMPPAGPGGAPGQHYQPGPGQPQGQQGMMPPGQGQPQQQQQQPGMGTPQHQPGPNEAALISFD